MTPTKSRTPLWVALIGSAFAGSLVAAQSRINGGLSNELGNSYVTAAVSFGSGLLVIAIFALLSRRARTGLTEVRREVREGRLPIWALTGGAFGACLVLSQGLIATVLGVALFTVGIVAGQVVGGLALDQLGLGPGGRVSPTAMRVIGAILAIIAVGISVVADQLNAAGDTRNLWLIIVPVFVGVGVSFQSAVNGLVRAAARSVRTSTLISFFVGTVILVIAALVSVALGGWPTGWPTSPWFYVGGPISVVFIALAAMLVRTAGVLLLSMSNVAGQLLASVALEAGLPLAGGLTAGLAAGAGVALIAVFIAALPQRQRKQFTENAAASV